MISALLSPPRNTFKSRIQSQNVVNSLLPPRPVSAPPQSTSFSFDSSGSEDPAKNSRALFDRRKLSSFASTNTRGGELIRPAPPLCEYTISSCKSHILIYIHLQFDLRHFGVKHGAQVSLVLPTLHQHISSDGQHLSPQGWIWTTLSQISPLFALNLVLVL